jgi:hypothetical protein
MEDRMPAWTAPYVLAILIALIALITISTFVGRRRDNRFHNGGYVSDSMLSRRLRDSVPAILSHGEHRIGNSFAAKFSALIARRSNFHPTTRRVLEVLDRMQKPEVSAVLSPRVEDAIMPELRVRGERRFVSEFVSPRTGNRYIAPSGSAWDFSCELGEALPPEQAGRVDDNGNITWLQGYSLSSGTVRIHPEEKAKAEAAGWDVLERVNLQGEVLDALATRDSASYPSAVFSAWDNNFNHAERARTLAEADAITGTEGEPLPTPPTPNIGSEDVPYQGPNYVDERSLVEEMKTVIHTGTEPSHED